MKTKEHSKQIERIYTESSLVLNKVCRLSKAKSGTAVYLPREGRPQKLGISKLKNSSVKGTKKPVAALKNLQGLVAERCAFNNCCPGDSPVSFIAGW